MPLFKVGDRVVRVGPFAQQYMKTGRVTQVFFQADRPESMTVYEVEFTSNVVTLYQSELRAADAPAEGHLVADLRKTSIKRL